MLFFTKYVKKEQKQLWKVNWSTQGSKKKKLKLLKVNSRMPEKYNSWNKIKQNIKSKVTHEIKRKIFLKRAEQWLKIIGLIWN